MFEHKIHNIKIMFPLGTVFAKTMVAYFCQPHIHLVMSKIFFKNVTYSVIIRQVENFHVIYLGILTGQNCLLVPTTANHIFTYVN